MSVFLKSVSRSFHRITLGAICAVTLGVSTPAQANDADQVNDPWEPFNRAMFDFNMVLDRNALAPVTRGYREVVPRPARAGIHNALANLMTPVDLLNNLLQGDLEGSAVTLKRFIVNTTAGIGGLIDAAAETGDERKYEDFGQTLAVWGVDSGHYIVWPLLGPSNPRDTVGSVVDTVSDPLFWMGMKSEWSQAGTASWTRTGLTIIDKREPLLDPLEELERTSVDYYVSIRDFYRQQRMLKIMNRSTKDRPEEGQGYRFNFPSDS